MARNKPTVADVRANKGKYRYTMMRTESWEEIAAAETAGIDMVSVPPEKLKGQRFRDVAPSLFAVPGLPLWAHDGSADGFLRWGFEMMRAGADAVYCAASIAAVKRMADEGIPVIGHVGLIPHTCTWTGGFKAVGKTAGSALEVYERCRQYEDAGAFGVEIEVVPAEVTAEIARYTKLFLISMGSGSGGDCQYLFAADVLGTNTGHVPRHAKQYANLASEYERLQGMRVEAFRSFVDEVKSGGYPQSEHIVTIAPAELEMFRAKLAIKSALHKVVR